MGLRDIVLPTFSLEVGGTDITVHGVSVADLSLLLQDYGPKVSAVFVHVTDAAKADPNADIKKIAMGAFKEFPDLVAGLIALAAGEYDDETIAIARRLPIPAQVELLEQIFLLTFASEGEVEKLVETLTRVATSLADSRILSRTSQGGIGVSDDT